VDLRAGGSVNPRGCGLTATIVATSTGNWHGGPDRDIRFSEADAVAITAAIRSDLRAAWDKVTAAYHGRAWVPLGYDSWDAYCASEFDDSRIRIPREQRQGVVTSLREEGLSLRAIAAATGSDYTTVQKDAAQVIGNRSPVTDLITSSDLAELNVPTPKVTSGLDDKTYQRPAPAPSGDVIDAEVVEETDRRDAERNKLTETKRRDAEERDARTFVAEHDPDLAAQVGDGLPFRTFAEAQFAWQQRNREEAQRIVRRKRPPPPTRSVG